MFGLSDAQKVQSGTLMGDTDTSTKASHFDPTPFDTITSTKTQTSAHTAPKQTQHTSSTQAASNILQPSPLFPQSRTPAPIKSMGKPSNMLSTDPATASLMAKNMSMLSSSTALGMRCFSYIFGFIGLLDSKLPSLFEYK